MRFFTIIVSIIHFIFPTWNNCLIDKKIASDEEYKEKAVSEFSWTIEVV